MEMTSDTMNKEEFLKNYVSSPFDKSQPCPTIDGGHVEGTVNILNSVDLNRNNTEDPNFISKTNDDDSDQPLLKYNGIPKKDVRGII